MGNVDATASNPTLAIAARLARDVGRLRFTTPSHVYNPLRYAWPAYSQYLERFGAARGRVLLVGTNPGPWGMAQTGVPFGEVAIAREWFHIEEPLRGRLPEQHRKYPILGFACTRSEGSGSRLWGWARERFGTPERFHAKFFVWNYCPLLFIGNNRNLVPGQLKKDEREPLLRVCDRSLAALVDALEPAAVFGIGRWAQERAAAVVDGRVPVGYLHHPSPANPAANRDWPALASAALAPWLPRTRPAPPRPRTSAARTDVLPSRHA